MKAFFKKFFLIFLYFVFPRRDKKASILMYHSVGDNKKFFTVTKEEFEWQLKYLKNKKVALKKLSELVISIKNKDFLPCIVLTFDDGYKDNYTEVFPLLKKYAIPATIFIITGKIGQKEGSHGQEEMLSEDNMREMLESGLIEFMPHTHTHKKLKNLTFSEVENEYKTSRHVLEKVTGMPAHIVSYPWGEYTDDVVSFLKGHGFIGGVTVREGLVDEGSDVFLLLRNSIDRDTTRLVFKVKTSKAIGMYKVIKDSVWG